MIIHRVPRSGSSDSRSPGVHDTVLLAKCGFRSTGLPVHLSLPMSPFLDCQILRSITGSYRTYGEQALHFQHEWLKFENAGAKTQLTWHMANITRISGAKDAGPDLT